MRNGVKLFEMASGMCVNWDKSMIMKLGVDFDLLENDQIQTLPRGQMTRVLGVMMGHKEDNTSGWVKLYDKINTVLNKTVRSVGCQIGDTLTMNSVGVGSCIFINAFQVIESESIAKVESMFTKFIRDDCVIISAAKRHASRADGQVVPLLKLSNIITTIHAKWIYKILCVKEQPAYTRL